MNTTPTDVLYTEAMLILRVAFPGFILSHENVAEVAEWLLKGGCVAIRNSTPEMHVSSSKYIQLIPKK